MQSKSERRRLEVKRDQLRKKLSKVDKALGNESNKDQLAVLRTWLEDQIQGIQRSSMRESSRGALSAFRETLNKIDDLQ